MGGAAVRRGEGGKRDLVVCKEKEEGCRERGGEDERREACRVRTVARGGVFETGRGEGASSRRGD